MKLSSLRKFLDSRLSAEALLAEIEADLVAYRHGLQERGRTVPVAVSEDCELAVSRADVASLVRAFLDGRLDSLQLAFIADALQLADGVEMADDWVPDAIAECTDPEIQGELTPDRARALLAAAGV